MAVHSNTTPFGVPATGLPAVPIDMAAVIAHLAMRPDVAEAFVAGLADALIKAKDAIDPDPDLEDTGDLEPAGDEGEPMLGSPEVEFNDRGFPERRGHIDQTHWADGHTNACHDDGDREVEINDLPQDDDELDESHDGCEPDEDGEPSLAATEQIDQNAAWRTHGCCTYPLDGEQDGFGNARPTHDWHRRERDRQIGREQGRALLDKSRKFVLPKSNFVQVRPGVLLFKGGRHV